MTMDKVLEGDLARFVVPDILTLLHMGRRTGVLVLERPARDRAAISPNEARAIHSTAPDEESKVFVREGRPVFAVATRDDLRLGALLVKTGRVTEADLSRTLTRQQSGSQRLGEVLLAEKILTEAELHSFLKVQVSEVIFDTFTWRPAPSPSSTTFRRPARS
jgi:hypothetical protein